MIKKTKEGWWIISEDTHVSKWVEQEGRLDHDQNTLPILYRYVRPGDVVLDIGANIGDHTIAYSDWVGSEGKVYAVECGSLACECLQKNLGSRSNVIIREIALWSEEGWLNFKLNDKNFGASHVEFNESNSNDNPVRCYSIDSLTIPRLDFVKIDAEGAETHILKGARRTILRLHPTLCLEVNSGALQRLGSSESELLTLLKGFGYQWKTLHPSEGNKDQYDIIAWWNP